MLCSKMFEMDHGVWLKWIWFPSLFLTIDGILPYLLFWLFVVSSLLRDIVEMHQSGVPTLISSQRPTRAPCTSPMTSLAFCLGVFKKKLRSRKNSFRNSAALHWCFFTPSSHFLPSPQRSCLPRMPCGGLGVVLTLVRCIWNMIRATISPGRRMFMHLHLTLTCWTTVLMSK